MKKYNIKAKGLEYNNLYFIDTLDKYYDYISVNFNKFDVSESEIKNLKTFIGHGHSFLTGIAGDLCGYYEDKTKREPMLFYIKLLKATLLKNQILDLINGKKLCINEYGGYFSIKPDEKYEIQEIKQKKYTIKDIRVKKWFGGSHYYVKIGNIDVVDKHGNMKWNTEKYAREMVIEYLKVVNNC